MDVFYEESAIARNPAEARRYNLLHIFSRIFLVLGLVVLAFGFAILPWQLLLLLCVWNFLTWFLLRRWKKKYNVSYDYCFVSGELRISRVFNINRRRLLTRIQATDILQMGDVDNSGFDGLRADPMTKTVVCTSNEDAEEGKFFLYLLVAENGKKLYVLECRETLLMHLLRFTGRAVLESDYVSQEKKAK